MLYSQLKKKEIPNSNQCEQSDENFGCLVYLLFHAILHLKLRHIHDCTALATSRGANKFSLKPKKPNEITLSQNKTKKYQKPKQTWVCVSELMRCVCDLRSAVVYTLLVTTQTRSSASMKKRTQSSARFLVFVGFGFFSFELDFLVLICPSPRARFKCSEIFYY